MGIPLRRVDSSNTQEVARWHAMDLASWIEVRTGQVVAPHTLYDKRTAEEWTSKVSVTSDA